MSAFAGAHGLVALTQIKFYLLPEGLEVVKMQGNVYKNSNGMIFTMLNVYI
jgi:hypothetical protein